MTESVSGRGVVVRTDIPQHPRAGMIYVLSLFSSSWPPRAQPVHGPDREICETARSVAQPGAEHCGRIQSHLRSIHFHRTILTSYDYVYDFSLAAPGTLCIGCIQEMSGR
jgi:hypothetical protein